jgi:hypothetical protein
MLAACATGRGKFRGEPVAVEVRNDLRPDQSVTVRVENGRGLRRVLGSVPAGQTRTLFFSETLLAGTFQLMAERPDGSRVTSSGFTLSPDALVVWHLQTNVVGVERQ